MAHMDERRTAIIGIRARVDRYDAQVQSTIGNEASRSSNAPDDARIRLVSRQKSYYLRDFIPTLDPDNSRLPDAFANKLRRFIEQRVTVNRGERRPTLEEVLGCKVLVRATVRKGS